MKREKTAVEYFNDALDEILQLYPSEWMEIQKAFNQAKQMEKEQIIKACEYGNNFEQGDLRCEVYYESKYGKDENKAENND